MPPAPLIGRGTRPLVYVPLALSCFAALFASVHAQVVTTIENTDPRLTYLPSLCDNSTSPSCNATWQILDFPGASANSVTSTAGSSSLPPQLFFVVRGISLTLRTSALSTASANVTLTASPSGVNLTTSFNATLGSISAINLPSAEDTTFALTYISPGRLDIDVITVQAVDASQTSLTTTPFPTSSTLPSFIIPAPTASSIPSSRPDSGLAQPVGTIVGESLAGFFGLILLGAATYELIRWRRRRRFAASSGAMEMRRRKGKARDPNPIPSARAPEP